MATKKKDTGIVNIHGKEYQTVAFRVGKFREIHNGYSLTTEVVSRTENDVVMKATIADDQGRILATGHAEEQRKSSQINKTSALENCETSAIGRALAALGIGGTEFASANEVQNAIHQQKTPTKAQQAAQDKNELDHMKKGFAEEINYCKSIEEIDATEHDWADRWPTKDSAEGAKKYANEARQKLAA